MQLDQPMRVAGLFICAHAGEPMSSLAKVQVTAGIGLEGDRYAAGRGAYSLMQPIKARHITFITQDGIDIANEWQEASGLPLFAAHQTRRNVLLTGMSPDALNRLVGCRFRVGDLSFVGLELATPCHRPSELSGQPGFEDAFEGRGGLRAQACSDGLLRVGDLLGEDLTESRPSEPASATR